MTEQDFWDVWDRLAQEKRFAILKGGYIRNSKGECPMCAVVNEKENTDYKVKFLDAATKVGLSQNFALDVMRAADDLLVNETIIKYRNKFLKGCEI